jgi:hypothetical protein
LQQVAAERQAHGAERCIIYLFDSALNNLSLDSPFF